MSSSRNEGAALRYAKRRREALRRARRAAGVDALLVLNAVDVRYLCGATEGVGALLVGKDCSVAFAGRMFEDRAPRECPGSEVRVCSRGAFEEAAARIRRAGFRRVGIQESHVTLAQYRALCKAVGERKLEPLGNVLGETRGIKDDEEIRLIRKAVRIAERAFRQLIGQGARHFVGRTERELAAELEHRMRLAGADRQAFAGGIIVASGPNSAGCHHRPTSRKVRRGEPVLFDWGAEVDGYRSDITRVVFVGHVPPRLREIYGIVLEAHDAAVAAMRPGVHAHTVNAIARKIVADAGYGREFRHGLGHGLGLETHEYPSFGKAAGKAVPLRKNMVMAVEPGIYLDRIGGIRIEDDVLVTADGHERLNSLPRRLGRVILR